MKVVQIISGGYGFRAKAGAPTKLILAGEVVCVDDAEAERLVKLGVAAEAELDAETKAIVEQADADSNDVETQEEASEAEEKPEGLAEIAIDDFAKVELRCAEVLSCEPIPKAKKLLKLQLDLGYEKRQVASGIAKFYKPEELIGKKVVLVANLKPAVLCGVESCGMILASSDKEGTVRVIFLDPETPNGAEIH